MRCARKYSQIIAFVNKVFLMRARRVYNSLKLHHRATESTEKIKISVFSVALW